MGASVATVIVRTEVLRAHKVTLAHPPSAYRINSASPKAATNNLFLLETYRRFQALWSLLRSRPVRTSEGRRAWCSRRSWLHATTKSDFATHLHGDLDFFV